MDFSKLPPELVYKIVSYVDNEGVVNLARVNSFLRLVCRDKGTWRRRRPIKICLFYRRCEKKWMKCPPVFDTVKLCQCFPDEEHEHLALLEKLKYSPCSVRKIVISSVITSAVIGSWLMRMSVTSTELFEMRPQCRGLFCQCGSSFCLGDCVNEETAMLSITHDSGEVTHFGQLADVDLLLLADAVHHSTSTLRGIKMGEEYNSLLTALLKTHKQTLTDVVLVARVHTICGGLREALCGLKEECHVTVTIALKHHIKVKKEKKGEESGQNDDDDHCESAKNQVSAHLALFTGKLSIYGGQCDRKELNLVWATAQ